MEKNSEGERSGEEVGEAESLVNVAAGWEDSVGASRKASPAPSASFAVIIGVFT